MIVDFGGEEIIVVTASASGSWAPAAVTTRPVTTIAPPEPRPSEPVPNVRNAVTNGWTLYLPPGDPVTRLNRVRVRGVEYPVQGEPARWEFGVIVQAYGAVLDDDYTARCRIRHSGGIRGAFNQATGTYDNSQPYAPHYDGPCSVVALAARGGDVEAAEEIIDARGYLVKVPVAVDTVRVGDEVEIYESADPVLNGRRLRVDDVVLGTSRVQRELLCVLA